MIELSSSSLGCECDRAPECKNAWICILKNVTKELQGRDKHSVKNVLQMISWTCSQFKTFCLTGELMLLLKKDLEFGLVLVYWVGICWLKSLKGLFMLKFKLWHYLHPYMIFIIKDDIWSCQLFFFLQGKSMASKHL